MGKHYKYEFKLQVVQEYLNSSLRYKAINKEIFYGESFDHFYQLE